MRNIKSPKGLITTDIREFRHIPEPLTLEQLEKVSKLEDYKGDIFHTEEEYSAAFKDKIFSYQGRNYSYRFKFGIKTRYTSENLILLGIFRVQDPQPITQVKLKVPSSLPLEAGV